MLLFASIIGIGLLLGLGFGGSLRHLADLEVRLWWLIPLALALQVAPVPRVEAVPSLPFIALLMSFAVVGLVVAMNWRLRGFPAILLGVVLNVIPIAINQGMPVSAAAVVDSGGDLAAVPRELGGKHHLERPSDEATILADVLAVREPFRAVVSIGDLVMWAGAAWFLTFALLGSPSRSVPATDPRRPGTRSTRT